MWKPGDKFIRNRASQGVPPCALFKHHMEGYTGVVRSVHRSSITDTRGRKHGFIAIDPNEDKDMAYHKSKYFAMRMDRDPESGDGGRLAFADHGAWAQNVTPMRDYPSQVKADVEKIIAEGDKFVVLQMHSLLEAEPPRPPIRVTEYK